MTGKKKGWNSTDTFIFYGTEYMNNKWKVIAEHIIVLLST